MKAKLLNLAWNGSPPPNDIAASECIPFIMVRAIYHGFRNGTISRSEGELMKGYVLRYYDLSDSERSSVLQYVIANLSEQGDTRSIVDMETLRKELEGIRGQSITA